MAASAPGPGDRPMAQAAAKKASQRFRSVNEMRAGQKVPG